ncbi:uncharacterized protein C8A04DRAFT_9726 [Dichotomopilus funicola]|uniref:SANT domain-containing protein n=1 Tax=Dichotomopilus funicola TaxID=1934379 RepID=A0AAN6V7W4_9PEZI|nr:hypothetical protein C8A04DRAFT_9726 [Dichotomopilus funicola]
MIRRFVQLKGYDYRSRYTGRFDGDRRSRSPRDRSPYGDRTDRGPQYPDADRRRPPPDSRGNPSGFPPSRDGFRDSLSGIQPPRGPKALIDPPSGPRGGGFAGDFRGRGRGGGRGRQWRDDSRDGGRDREDYRDRPHFRDERSRERERVHDRDRDRDREWPPRDQRDRPDFPRARRPSPPPLRARSPLPSRDFRDTRDPPLGVDADRGRRGSRDGPLSAGSSNSDPMFSQSPFRGGFRGGSRGGGRGRGDWDQRTGRDRGNFYDDRDRYPRSRSQESRWGREADDRDRRDSRYAEPGRDPRDDREVRERENRDRELIRPKADRVSHEPPSAKDVSPPPIAPSAPAFGSVPSRQNTATTEIQSLTGKPPPTGPRALTEERPVSAGHAVGNERPPPTGPSKPALSDGGPPIPLGPRAQQKQQRSSKQWINPSLNVKKSQVESPKTARSQNFPLQSARPSGSSSSHSEFHRDFDKRPRSPGARSDSHALGAERERFGLHVATGPNEIMIKSERGSQSARASVDRETKTAPNSADIKMGGMDLDRPREQQEKARLNEQAVSPAASSKPGDSVPEQPTEPQPAIQKKFTVLAVPFSRVQLPPREAPPPASDESSESDDDEDMDVYFEREISKTESELKRARDAAEKVPMPIVRRYAGLVHTALLSVLNNDEASLTKLVGPVPENFTFPRVKPSAEVAIKEVPGAGADETVAQEKGQDQAQGQPVREPSAIPTVEKADEQPAVERPEPQPKVEEVDTEGSGLPPVPEIGKSKPLDHDVDMRDAADAEPAAIQAPVPTHVPTAREGLGILLQPPVGRPGLDKNNVSREGSENRTEDDASIYGSVEVVREFSATPPAEDLPMYNVKPWFRSRRVRKMGEQAANFGDFLFHHFQDQTVSAHLAQDELRQEYRKKYDAYLRFTHSDDQAAIRSRDFFASSGVQPGTTGKAAAADSKPEGGRRGAGRFATEFDLDYAIKESIREHEEMREREARALKEKYRTEKEASIPEMFWTEEEKDQVNFYDTAGLLPLEKLVATWQVVPQHVNFTQDEADKFEKAYLETPKQWGRISREVGKRDPGTCILYYYAKKRDLNLKDKLKKQPRRRKKGRGKQRSSALVSELGNTENETEDTSGAGAGQETGENGERRRPPRRAAAPVWGNNDNATPNADSDGATPAPTPGRRRAGTTADAKDGPGGVDRPEAAKRGGRKARQPRADKEAKGPKQLAQAPGPGGGVPLAVPSGKPGRARANSKAQGPEWLSPSTTVDMAAASRTPLPFDVPHGAAAGASGGMQPPLVPVQQQGQLASPERGGPPPISSTISEVMAPPSLRPEPPPPPPPASVPTFEISQPAGPDRIRTPQQASSYWSVSETTDFPGLLRAFGTDWSKIANHMQTKTATMTKEGTKPEWEQIAMEADGKGSRGEKRPLPPTPTQGPRKRYDVSSATGHRPLAAAEPDEGMLTKVEPQPQPSQPFLRFQVPIAQAAPVSHTLGQPPTSTTATASQQAPSASPAVSQAMSPHTHPLRPPAPSYSYPEREIREMEPQPLSQQQQPVRISQKPVSTAVPKTTAPIPSVPEPAPSRTAQWQNDLGGQFSLLSQQADKARGGPRDVRDRSRLDLGPRDSPRPADRAPPLRMKQEPESALHHPHPDAYPPYQPAQRGMSSRTEPAPLGRPQQAQPQPPGQPEPSRSTASYPPPIHTQQQQQQSGRSLFGEPPQPSQISPANERPLSSIPRRTPVPMQDSPYGAAPSSSSLPSPAPPVQPPAQQQQQAAPAPVPPRAPERKVNIMSLLNDDEPPAPKRVAEVSAPNRSLTPQPLSRPPPATSLPPRRDVETGYPYARNPGQPPQSAIPPLKPYHTQSPQPGHMRVPSSGMPGMDRMDRMERMDTGPDAQRDYYARHSYPAQHISASNSPQSQHTPYAPPGQHHPQHSQSSQGGYPTQQPYQTYQVSQSRPPSPPSQYPPHPSMSGRREAVPAPRESWLQQQQPMHPHQHPHPHQHQHHPQQQPLPHHGHQQRPSQSGWPPHQAPPKPSQSLPTQSAWAAQNGGVPTKPSVSSPLPAQQHHVWPTAGPGQQQQQQAQQPSASHQSHPLNLRDPRGPSVYESQSPTTGMPTHPHHQHHNSLGGGSSAGRYVPSPQDSIRRGEQPTPLAPQQPQQQQPTSGGGSSANSSTGGPQAPYARYANTPGPAVQHPPPGRELPGRSYTPVPGGFDLRGSQGAPRGPPGPPGSQSQIRDQQLRDQQMREGFSHQHQQQQHQHVHQQQMREAQMRENQMRESQMRESQLREAQQQQQQGQGGSGSGGSGSGNGILGRQLRPGPPGPSEGAMGGGERRY